APLLGDDAHRFPLRPEATVDEILQIGGSTLIPPGNHAENRFDNPRQPEWIAPRRIDFVPTSFAHCDVSH
ncbi:hypothetical protein, partial [Nocardia sp. NPDC057030]|uniref:hypothetical protein n=1 Tax=Nocardia sp. NPDC057030 TaxID=3346005 RepID=UPI003631ADBA